MSIIIVGIDFSVHACGLALVIAQKSHSNSMRKATELSAYDKVSHVQVG